MNLNNHNDFFYPRVRTYNQLNSPAFDEENDDDFYPKKFHSFNYLPAT
jgi:hypothetical protein